MISTNVRLMRLKPIILIGITDRNHITLIREFFRPSFDALFGNKSKIIAGDVTVWIWKIKIVCADFFFTKRALWKPIVLDFTEFTDNLFGIRDIFEWYTRV